MTHVRMARAGVYQAPTRSASKTGWYHGPEVLASCVDSQLLITIGICPRSDMLEDLHSAFTKRPSLSKPPESPYHQNADE
ncbi:hypothetical protein VUR80DRAFT_7424 [Thermomyces stellatus]